MPTLRNRKVVDLSGRSFNHWTVLSPLKHEVTSGARVFQRTDWLCRCTCGREKLLPPGRLLSGAARSCGCTGSRHGFARRDSGPIRKHPIYNAWINMKTRCYNEKRVQWKDYGGRGITVCSEWASFDRFRKDMESTWLPGLTLDRVDTNKNYCLENCIWSSKAEQQRNKRNNRRMQTPDGILCVSEAVRRFSKLNAATVLWRLGQGWSDEDALFKPDTRFKNKDLHGRPAVT